MIILTLQTIEFYVTEVDDIKQIERFHVDSSQKHYFLGGENANLGPSALYEKYTPLLAKLHTPTAIKNALKPKTKKAFIPKIANVSSTLRHAIIPRFESAKKVFIPKIDKFIQNDKNDLDSKDGIKFSDLLTPKVESQTNLHVNSRGHADHTVHNHITHSDFMNSHLNDSIVFLHAHTRHVAAQFRNIFPRTVKMWFVTGENSAVVQGFLRTGAETTLNGWAGHQFYFTVEENGKCKIFHSL